MAYLSYSRSPSSTPLSRGVSAETERPGTSRVSMSQTWSVGVLFALLVGCSPILALGSTRIAGAAGSVSCNGVMPAPGGGSRSDSGFCGAASGFGGAVFGGWIGLGTPYPLCGSDGR